MRFLLLPAATSIVTACSGTTTTLPGDDGGTGNDGGSDGATTSDGNAPDTGNGGDRRGHAQPHGLRRRVGQQRIDADDRLRRRQLDAELQGGSDADEHELPVNR